MSTICLFVKFSLMTISGERQIHFAITDIVILLLCCFMYGVIGVTLIIVFKHYFLISTWLSFLRWYKRRGRRGSESGRQHCKDYMTDL